MLEELLERSAGRFPDKTALVCGEQRLTYREVEERANRQAHQLIASGVKRGDRVAICMENSPQAAIAIFSVLKAGAVFLMIHPATKPERLQYILNDCSARLLSTEETGARFLSTRPRKQGIDIDLAALIYTSGSTGLPKGVMLTHLNMQSTASSIAAYLKNTETDIVLNVLPLSFGYGLYQLLVAFQVGAMLVLEKSFTYPFVVVETILRERVTGLPLVPTIISILLQMDLSKYQIRSLRYITSAAAALPVKHIEKLRALFPDVAIFSMYGMTECQRASYLDPAQIDYRPGSVGRGMPNEEVYIVDERGKKVGPRVTGELVIRGSNVMRGYWNLPVETDQVLRPGPLPGERVLYSGDLFLLR